MGGSQSITVILPVLNEEKIIQISLEHLNALGASEVIVVDGGSTDRTCDIVRDKFPNVRLLRTERAERAFQMNVGAFEARSDLLLFVHADMKFPADALSLIRSALKPGFVGGGFAKRFKCETILLCVMRMLMNFIYFDCVRALVGTNAIFVKREVFKRLQGFPEVPILEDVVFSSRLKKAGKIARIGQSVLVSSRRYLERGVIRQVLKNIEIMVRFYLFDHDPSILKESYEGNLKGGYR